MPRERLRGTIQTDILKEYIAQKEYIFPPEPSMRLVTDMVEFCTREMPLWHPISISGYHIREAGSTAAQELAFTLADGFTYVEWAIERGLDVDEFAPRLSFFFNAHLDFFEEIAKYRAARRIWARTMRERYGAKNPRSWLMRFHTQTAGVSLTAQQPEVNIVRTAIEALAAVLGGTQSLHTNSFDEALALPTEDAVRIALRTQQVIAHETGVVNVDRSARRQLPRRGADQRARAAGVRLLRADRAARRRRRGDQGELLPEGDRRGVVPVPVRGRGAPADRRRREPLRARDRAAARDPEDRSCARDEADRPRAGLRARRDSAAVEAALARLKEDAARDDRNLMHPIVDAVARVRDDGRDVRRVPRGVGHLAGDAGLLELSAPARRRRARARRASRARPGRCTSRRRACAGRRSRCFAAVR